jgi:hypothetical protein
MLDVIREPLVGVATRPAAFARSGHSARQPARVRRFVLGCGVRVVNGGLLVVWGHLDDALSGLLGSARTW